MKNSKNFNILLEKAMSSSLGDDEDIKVNNFIEITGGNLDYLFEYLTSAYQGVRLSSIGAGLYIEDRFNNDFYHKREVKRYNDYIKSVEDYCAKLGRKPSCFDF